VSDNAEWMATHKGEYLKSWGYVWTCDDDCGCEQAQIVDYYRNKVVYNARVPITAWAGEFHTDHEPGADAELAAYRRRLREVDPDREAAIEWQRGVDYDA
jgi:hypothetical protein